MVMTSKTNAAHNQKQGIHGMPNHSGSCHCGNVQFSISGAITEMTTCDCSLCVKKNALMVKVYEDEFSLQTSWEDLSVYQWNTRVARHYFCSNCGIYTFHRKRAQPDHFGINVCCLDGLERSQIPVRATEGASMTLQCDDPRPEWPGPSE